MVHVFADMHHASAEAVRAYQIPVTLAYCLQLSYGLALPGCMWVSILG